MKKFRVTLEPSLIREDKHTHGHVNTPLVLIPSGTPPNLSTTSTKTILDQPPTSTDDL